MSSVPCLQVAEKGILTKGDCYITAKMEELFVLCGYLSFIVGNLQVIIQLYGLSTINSLYRRVLYITASCSHAYC